MEARLLNGMAEISQADWDALACPEGARPTDPFTTHRFLAALDRSGSTGKGTGWQPRPLVLQDGQTVAALPLYVKSHSQGEYIFDHAWAQGYERAGGRYYPKLQAAVPFTPATGRRFLCDPSLRETLLGAAIGLAEQNGLSSLHITFCTADEAESLAGTHGLLHRITQQFHWENRGYASFDDFLSDLSSRKRKMIRKERETAQGRRAGYSRPDRRSDRTRALGCLLAFLSGHRQPQMGNPLPDPRLLRRNPGHICATISLLVLAFDGPRPVAGALNFIGRDTLYGRYWGCTEDHPCLHFELCYYQAIDWAIANGLQRVEAGAQGEHKLARGYLPTPVHSLHWIADPGFRAAVAQYLAQERRAVDEEIEVLTAYGPFRRVSSED